MGDLLARLQSALGDPYRIERELGGGGMSRVFLAQETVLISGKHAVVTDFGVSKAVSASSGGSLTSLGVALGTPAYMAPEQAAADPHLDHRADLYALGILGYEMLTGRPPFTAATPQATPAAQATQTPQPVTP